MKQFAGNSCTACGVDCTPSEWAVTSVEENIGSVPGCKGEIKSVCTATAVSSFFGKRSNLKRHLGLTVIVSTGSGAPKFVSYTVPRGIARSACLQGL
jgi:hypothetical protein